MSDHMRTLSTCQALSLRNKRTRFNLASVKLASNLIKSPAEVLSFREAVTLSLYFKRDGLEPRKSRYPRGPGCVSRWRGRVTGGSQSYNRKPRARRRRRAINIRGKGNLLSKLRCTTSCSDNNNTTIFFHARRVGYRATMDPACCALSRDDDAHLRVFLFFSFLETHVYDSRRRGLVFEVPQHAFFMKARLL